MKQLLTIGLIVKNEEKTLARCLDSLRSLMTELDAELIITDTGSTDQTAEIARKYTDQVCFFEWNGDFSAARNVAIDRAKGQWFLGIDADEWFESTDEIITFFKSGEYKKYNAATYHVHNYVDNKNDTYTESTVVRLFKQKGTVRYTGAIHECLPIIEPMKILECFVHHTGYAYETEEAKQKKHQRNLRPLLKELEADPNDERTLYHIMSQYTTVREWDNALSYKSRILDVMRKKPDSNFRGGLYKMLVWTEVEKNQLREAIETAAEYFAVNKQAYAADLDIWYLLIDAYLKMENNEKAAEATRNYLGLYDRYHKGMLKNANLLAGAMLSVDSEYYLAVVQSTIGRLLRDHQYTEALSLFRMVDLERLAEIRKQEVFWNGLLQAVTETQGSDMLGVFTDKILALKELGAQKEAMACLLTCMATFYDRDYYGMMLSPLFDSHETARQLLYEVYKDFSFSTELESLNMGFFVLNIFELLLKEQGLEFLHKKELFVTYTRELRNYVQQVYNPEIWENGWLELLPGFAQFALIAGKSVENSSQNDTLSYLKDLVQGAKAYPVMLAFIKELLIDIRRKDNSEA